MKIVWIFSWLNTVLDALDTVIVSRIDNVSSDMKMSILVNFFRLSQDIMVPIFQEKFLPNGFYQTYIISIFCQTNYTEPIQISFDLVH